MPYCGHVSCFLNCYSISVAGMAFTPILLHMGGRTCKINRIERAKVCAFEFHSSCPILSHGGYLNFSHSNMSMVSIYLTFANVIDEHWCAIVF